MARKNSALPFIKLPSRTSNWTYRYQMKIECRALELRINSQNGSYKLQTPHTLNIPQPVQTEIVQYAYSDSVADAIPTIWRRATDCEKDFCFCPCQYANEFTPVKYQSHLLSASSKYRRTRPSTCVRASFKPYNVRKIVLLGYRDIACSSTSRSKPGLKAPSRECRYNNLAWSSNASSSATLCSGNLSRRVLIAPS